VDRGRSASALGTIFSQTRRPIVTVTQKNDILRETH